MAEIKDEILAWLSKGTAWLLYIAIGLIGKFSYDMITRRKITFMQALASTGAALFVGFVTGAICMHNGLEDKQMIIIPVSTLLSEKIMLAVFTVDIRKHLSEWFSWWAKKFRE